MFGQRPDDPTTDSFGTVQGIMVSFDAAGGTVRLALAHPRIPPPPPWNSSRRSLIQDAHMNNRRRSSANRDFTVGASKVTLRIMSGAALYCWLPDWLAKTVHVPGANATIVRPTVAHTAGVRLDSRTGSPDEASAGIVSEYPPRLNPVGNWIDSPSSSPRAIV